MICFQQPHQPSYRGHGRDLFVRCAVVGLLFALIAGEPVAWGQCCLSAGGWQACEATPGLDWRWIDWEGAVRRGARNAVVRGFNGEPTPAANEPGDASVRRQAAAEVIQYFNG